MFLLEMRCKNGVFRLSQNSLIEEKTEAIVNPANEGLVHGGGVAGLISRAGGPAIQMESDRKAPVATGGATYTTAGALSYKYIIHAVGPVYHNGRSGEPEKLASAVRSALQLANNLDIASLALPAVSTGIFGYPLESAIPIIVGVIRDFLAGEVTLTDIRLVEFSADKAQEIKKIIETIPEPIP